MLSVDEWDYLAEGNHHVILKYTGSSTSCSHSTYIGKILRIAKSNPSKLLDRSDDSNQLSFLRVVMGPFFSSRYICYPVEISIDRGFLHKISEKINPIRPLSRRVKHIPMESCGGHLELNLTDCVRHDSVLPEKISPTICIEIKVKCGLISCSPLVHEGNLRIKTRCSRYHIMQLVKRAQDRRGILTPWDSHVSNVSSYSPASLCSGEFTQVHNSCKYLLENPQNNFIVYENSCPIYGLSRTSPAQFESLCKRLLCVERSGDAAEDTPLDSFLRLVSMILCREDILQRLQLLQALDVIDIEGAHMILMRLSSLMGNDVDSATAKVQECICSHGLCPDVLSVVADRLSCSNEKKKSVMLSQMLVGQNQTALNCYETFGEALTVKQIFNIEKILLQDLYAFRISSETPEDVRLQMRLSAMMYIDNLDQLHCILLLRMWLLALGASDASIMLCLERGPLNDVPERLMAANSSGIIYYDSCKQIIPFLYSLNVADIGPKPATKILSKFEEENGIICNSAVEEEYLHR